MRFQRPFLFCLETEDDDTGEVAAGVVGVCIPVKRLLAGKDTLNDCFCYRS